MRRTYPPPGAAVVSYRSWAQYWWGPERGSETKKPLVAPCGPLPLSPPAELLPAGRWANT